MTSWKSIYAEPPVSGTYFVVIPSDGSGSSLYVAVDGGPNGEVDFLDVETHEVEDPESVYLDGAIWSEAPREIVEPFFLRHDD